MNNKHNDNTYIIHDMKYNAPGISANYDTLVKMNTIDMPELVRYRKTPNGYVSIPVQPKAKQIKQNMESTNKILTIEETNLNSNIKAKL